MMRKMRMIKSAEMKKRKTKYELTPAERILRIEFMRVLDMLQEIRPRGKKIDWSKFFGSAGLIDDCVRVTFRKGSANDNGRRENF